MFATPGKERIPSAEFHSENEQTYHLHIIVPQLAKYFSLLNPIVQKATSVLPHGFWLYGILEMDRNVQGPDALVRCNQVDFPVENIRFLIEKVDKLIATIESMPQPDVFLAIERIQQTVGNQFDFLNPGHKDFQFFINQVNQRLREKKIKEWSREKTEHERTKKRQSDNNNSNSGGSGSGSSSGTSQHHHQHHHHHSEKGHRSEIDVKVEKPRGGSNSSSSNNNNNNNDNNNNNNSNNNSNRNSSGSSSGNSSGSGSSHHDRNNSTQSNIRDTEKHKVPSRNRSDNTSPRGNGPNFDFKQSSSASSSSSLPSPSFSSSTSLSTASTNFLSSILSDSSTSSSTIGDRGRERETRDEPSYYQPQQQQHNQHYQSQQSHQSQQYGNVPPLSRRASYDTSISSTSSSLSSSPRGDSSNLYSKEPQLMRSRSDDHYYGRDNRNEEDYRNEKRRAEWTDSTSSSSRKSRFS